ncbi:MAG TPA: VOC family protein [Alphaproteobacteria bacterium]|nr:VOC family protein [Alphaproteobacteria bacterium]
MLPSSPIWPAPLDHLRVESDNPPALADSYCRALGFEIYPLGEDFLLQAYGRRLIVGREAPGCRTYRADRLQGERQLEDVQAYIAAKRLPVELSPTLILRGDAVAVRDPDGWLNVFGLPRPAMVELYEQGSGFLPSDYALIDEEDPAGKRVAFWRTDPEHPTFAAFHASHAKADHHAYETSGWMDFRDWADHLSHLRIPIAWGAGRHRPGNNLFFMIDDPYGERIEFSAELERLPQQTGPLTWPHTERTVNLWGAGWMRQ